MTDTTPKEVVESFETLAEKNLKSGNHEAAGAYDDAANYVREELVGEESNGAIIETGEDDSSAGFVERFDLPHPDELEGDDE